MDLRVLRHLLDKPPAGLIVASFGRSGSTVMFNAAVDAMRNMGGRRRKKTVRHLAWSLDQAELQQGHIYKTHDYPSALAGRSDLRSVFLFGSASDAVLSVLQCRETFGDDWIAEHFEHLKAPGRFEDLTKTDALGIAAQFDAWTTFSDSPVLCVRYETLWDNVDTLRDFTGLPLRFPQKRARKDKTVNQELRSALDKIYGPLDARIAEVPDIFIGGSLQELV